MSKLFLGAASAFALTLGAVAFAPAPASAQPGMSRIHVSPSARHRRPVCKMQWVVRHTRHGVHRERVRVCR
jgi:hypothetical protein